MVSPSTHLSTSTKVTTLNETRNQIVSCTMSNEKANPTIIITDSSNDDLANESLREIEFRSPDDEAWCRVHVEELDDGLVVSFNGCQYKDFYFPEYFNNYDEVKEFEERFRACSIQMQDIQCATVSKGMKVCSTCPSVSGEVKFYDAIVDEVLREKHGLDEEGNEVCRCDFKLNWNHGPFVNTITSAKVGDICLIQEDKRMNPIVVSFFKETRRQLDEEARQGEETVWRKILNKVITCGILNRNSDPPVPENQG